MPMPRVAIVGRPNVGKSSLLNMLARNRVSIVDPTPGVTRDRVSAVVELALRDPKRPDRLVEFVDTGGYGVYVAEGARFDDIGADLSALTAPIESQIAEALRTADLVLFVIDAQVGPTAADLEIARMLREGAFTRRTTKKQSQIASQERRDKPPPIAVVANKVDGEGWEPSAYEAAGLGFGEPLVVSAASNYRRRDFLERLYDLLPPPGETLADEQPEANPLMRLAIVGKRNAGKSSLVNALAGEERVIVSEIAGTTRDAVDVRFERDGQSFIAIDTAGVRKRKSMSDQIEWYAYARAQSAIERADVALFIIDASLPISKVDKQLSLQIQKAFTPCVLVVNKWDLARGKRNKKGQVVTTDDYREYLDKELKGLDYCPLVFVSAKETTEAIEAGAEERLRDPGNIWSAIGVAFDLFEESRQRVTTGELNRVFREIVDHHPPPSKLGKRLKVLYVAQVGVAPPTIALVVNDPNLITPVYERYLMNQIRERLPFDEVPVRLIVRERKRLGLKELHQQGRQGAAASGRRMRVEGISEEDFESLDLSDWETDDPRDIRDHREHIPAQVEDFDDDDFEDGDEGADEDER